MPSLNDVITEPVLKKLDNIAELKQLLSELLVNRPALLWVNKKNRDIIKGQHWNFIQDADDCNDQVMSNIEKLKTPENNYFCYLLS